MEKVIKLPS